MANANVNVTLEPLTEDDRESFILDNQEAFNYGALAEFGQRDNHFEEDGEIISRDTITHSIETGIAYRIIHDGKKVGGMVIRVNGEEGELELLFVNPAQHTKGIGYAAWLALERMYPTVKKWTTHTPYFETRNIHFYINKCGFHAVEFFHKLHPDPHDPDADYTADDNAGGLSDGMFKFEKIIR